MNAPLPLDENPSTRGARILAVTGIAFTTLTLAGGTMQWLYPDALWARVFFAVSISGLVGFATNWVAIKMLFHPRVRVFGVQGVVPSRRKELARSVGLTLEKHLISGDRMLRLLESTGAIETGLQRLTARLPQLLNQPGARELVLREVTATIESSMNSVVVSAKETLREKARSNLTALLTGATAAASFGPMAGMLAAGITKSGMFDTIMGRLIDDMAGDLRRSGGLDEAARNVVNQLPQRAEELLQQDEMREVLKDQFGQVAEQLLKAVDVASLIENELLGRDESELEQLIDSVAANELCFIQVAGGGLGMVAGLALVWPWLLLPIGCVFLVLVQIARMAERRFNAAKSDPKPQPAGKPESSSRADAVAETG